MAGQAQPSYGEKYGGFPTRDMLNDAALGYALNIRDIGDYARSQQAALSAPLEASLQKTYDTNTANQAFRTAVEPQKAPPVRSNLFDLAKPRNVVIEDANARSLAALQARTKAKDDEAFAQLTKEYNAQVLPYEQIAETISGTPISQLARQALMTQYGVDPNVARATFTEQTDLDYAKLQRDAELAAAGVDFSMSEGEMIYNEGGVEAWNKYRDQKTFEALNGTPAERAKAEQDLIDSENAPIDADILANYGIAPKEVTNADADTVRAMFTDPDFVAKWIMPSFELLDASNGITTAAEIAGKQAQAYLEANPNDILRAKTLAAIIAEFDFYAR
jgi:methylphosphotriester-DNA--protein-cysteine methyltransferase